jgi:polysaccharide export outer membrane protein
MRRSLLLESMTLLVGIFVSGCAAYSQTAAAPQGAQSQQPPVSLSPAMPLANSPADPSKLAEPAGAKPPSVPVDVATFVLGPEDQISVVMWDEPSFNGSYTIRPDGKINVPLIGEIQAQGLTPMQLQQAIDKAALSQLKTPRSTVNVVGVHSKHIYFDGEGIGSPGAMDLVIPIHLLEGISARGGFKDFADKNHIKILRDGKLFKTVKYKDLVSGKHPELNILLQDKDHVIVN